MRVIVWGTRTFTSKVNSIPPYPRAHLTVFTGNQGYWALFRVEIIRAKGVGLVLLFLVPTPCMQHRHLCHPIGHCCVLSLPGSRWGIKTRLKLAVHIQIFKPSSIIFYNVESLAVVQYPASSDNAPKPWRVQRAATTKLRSISIPPRTLIARFQFLLSGSKRANIWLHLL